MKKIISILVVTVLCSLHFFATSVYAQDDYKPGLTILPQTSPQGCEEQLKDIETKNEFLKKDGSAASTPGEWFAQLPQTTKNGILGCAIITGKIHFWMIPYFIVYIIEFLIGIAGLIAILFFVIGGYQFIIGGATDKRDQAKATLRNAIIGLILVTVAWVVVNVVQFILTI